MNEPFSAKITIIINKIVFRVAVNTYVPIFRGLDARGGRKLRTETRGTTSLYSDNNTRDNHMQYITIIIGFIDKPLTFNIGLLQLIFHTSVFT